MMSMADTLSPEKRQQILHGAGVIFAADGYEGASMSRIAAEANVSKGTLYNHFDGKAELFAAFVDQLCTRTLAHVFGAIEEREDTAAILRGIGGRMLEMMCAPTGRMIYRLVVGEAPKFPHLARIFYEAGPARAIRELSAWLAQETARGRLAVPDPDFAAEQFFALCQTRVGLQSKLHIVPEPDAATIELVVAGAVTLFLRSYAA